MNTVREKQNIEGFTLIELLVVIAIICILVAMIFPIARNATERSVRSTCLSNLQIIARSVGSYHQDHGVYPPEPGVIGAHGIPTGGITGLALEDASLSTKNLWCEKDPYPENFPTKPNYIPRRDNTNSSYGRDYNYYGYATDVSGMPFPVTDETAAYYLFGSDVVDNAPVVDKLNSFASFITSGIPYGSGSNGDLMLVDKRTDKGKDYYRPKALFPGLWNPNASPDTIITCCRFHNPGTAVSIPLPIVNLAGTATVIWVDKPALTNAGYTNRRPDDRAVKLPPIDWRINKDAFPFLNKGKQPENSMMGDSLGNATAKIMPIIRSFYRQFGDADIGKFGVSYMWYDTAIDVRPGDLIMVAANSKWNYVAKNSLANLDPNEFKNIDGSVKSAYSSLFNEDGYLWFSPDGDVAGGTRDTMLCPNYPHCLLVGEIGDMNVLGAADPAAILVPPEKNRDIRTKYVFPIGSRYSYIVPDGVSGTFRLAMNDTEGLYGDNQGWGEIWVGFYRPSVAAH